MDTFSKEKRSEIMSHIRSENTGVEMIVFTYLRKEKIYFQKHYKKVYGSPDIALPRKKKAIFIDGDFWHGRDFKRFQSNRDPNDYWIQKIKTNILRDKKQRLALRKSGWSVLKVWESEIKRKTSRQNQLERIKLFLKN